MEPIQPYGSHWIKERMTKEQRKADSWSCGAASTVKDNYGPDERLLNQWRICMQSKGYVYIDKCDARCLDP